MVHVHCGCSQTLTTCTRRTTTYGHCLCIAPDAAGAAAVFAMHGINFRQQQQQKLINIAINVGLQAN